MRAIDCLGRTRLIAALGAALFAAAGLSHPLRAAEPVAPAPTAAESDGAASLSRDLRPYRVSLSIGCALDPGLTPEFRQALLRDVTSLTERYIGQMWQPRIEPARDHWPTTRVTLDRVSVDQCLNWTSRLDTPAAAPTVPLDKLILLVLETEGSGYRVSGREFDSATRTLTAVHQRTTSDRSALPQTVLELVHVLYRPVSAIEVNRARAVFVRAHAGERPPPDPTWAPLQAGQWLQPWHRSLDPQPGRDPVQLVPWTYLQVSQPARAVAPCEVVTGLRAPFGARRNKIETLALAAVPQTDRTRLTLVTRRPAERPLSGIDVDVRHQLPAPSTQDAAAAPASRIPAPPRFVSDRDGSFELAGVPGHPQVWLYFRSGQALLARLPFIPGLVDSAVLELPDDALRLSVEGQVSLLQAELVDTVARRAIQVARIRQRARLGQWTEVERLLKELEKLPRLAAFRTRLNALRLTSLQAADTLKDRAATARITELCDESAELIARYLDQDKLAALREELDELRQVQAEDKLDAAPPAAPAAAPTAQ